MRGAAMGRIAAKTMKAVRIGAYGDSSVLRVEQIAVPALGRGQLLVRVHAAGVNYVDTYQRCGLYKGVPLPMTLGKEGAGRVLEVADDVEEFRAGDCVSWFGAQGSYAEYVVVNANQALPVPDGVSLVDAAALTLQGLTAHYLATSTFAIKPNDRVLIHAGAGGTGRLLIQIAKIKGATVFTTVGTEAKAHIARDAGADHVIMYRECDFAEEILQLTKGAKCHAVYDSVGKDTWERSLACVARLGSLVLYGNASGPVPPIDPLLMMKAGSLYMTRPTLADYVVTRDEMLNRMNELYDWMAAGQLNLSIGATFTLDEAAKAQDALTGRLTTGKLLLTTTTE